MLYIILSILFLASISVIYAVSNTPKRIKEFEGFSNTALKKALNGELPGKTVKEMQDAIRVSDDLKREAMKPKGPTLIPLS